MKELKNTRERLGVFQNLKNIMPENKYKDDNILVKWSKGLSGESPIDEYLVDAMNVNAAFSCI